MTKEQAMYLVAGMYLGKTAPDRETFDRVAKQLLARYQLSAEEVAALLSQSVEKEMHLLH